MGCPMNHHLGVSSACLHCKARNLALCFTSEPISALEACNLDHAAGPLHRINTQRMGGRDDGSSESGVSGPAMSKVRKQLRLKGAVTQVAARGPGDVPRVEQWQNGQKRVHSSLLARVRKAWAGGCGGATCDAWRKRTIHSKPACGRACRTCVQRAAAVAAVR